MTEVMFSVPQNDRTTRLWAFNLAFLLGHRIDQRDNFSPMIINFALECTIRKVQENSRDSNRMTDTLDSGLR